MDELRGIALILEGVIEEGIAHANQALLFGTIKIVAELLIPHPVTSIARLYDSVIEELLHDIDVVDNIQDQRLHLDKD